MTITLQKPRSDLIVFNDEGKLTYVNSALCTRIGRARKSLVGNSVEILLAPKARTFYQTYIMPLLQVDQDVCEVYVPLVDHEGNEIPMLLKCNRQKTGRKITRNVCTCMPVNPAKEDETEVTEVHQKLREAKAERQELLVRLGEAYTALAHQSQEWEKLREELGSMAYQDLLTGLLNRRGFEERLEEEVLDVARTKSQFSILIVDVDHFKWVNDTYGHSAGDDVLKGVAEVLTKAVRKLDVVARWGGEEFVILLPKTGRSASLKAAERVRKAIRSTWFGEISVTVSIGASTCDRKEGSCENMMGSADRALYAAKNAGRNQVVHNSELRELADRRGNSASLN